jgi:hypothetical protein
MPTAAKIGLQLFGAVGLTAALLGVQGYDQIHRYEMDHIPAQVRHVPQGEPAKLEHATWRVLSIAPMAKQPEGMQADRVMLQIDIDGTALSAEGRYYDTSPPGFFMADDTGRTWLAQAYKSPEDMRLGVPARFNLLSVVPKALQDQVELMVWPSQRVGLEESGPALRFDR